MLSYQWFGTVGIMVTMIIGAVVSLITGTKLAGPLSVAVCLFTLSLRVYWIVCHRRNLCIFEWVISLMMEFICSNLPERSK